MKLYIDKLYKELTIHTKLNLRDGLMKYHNELGVVVSTPLNNVKSARCKYCIVPCKYGKDTMTEKKYNLIIICDEYRLPYFIEEIF